MILEIGEKLKLMRESERITSRNEAAELIGIPHNALWRYETGESIPKGDVMMKILNCPRFEKYALWFMTGKIAPELRAGSSGSRTLWARANGLTPIRKENWLTLYYSSFYQNLG